MLTTIFYHPEPFNLAKKYRDQIQSGIEKHLITDDDTTKRKRTPVARRRIGEEDEVFFSH
jgi:hypothetical protein